MILGDRKVGTKSLLLRYSDNTFSDTYYSALGVDFKIRTIEMDGKTLKLQIWNAIENHPGYFKDAHGVFIAYSITDQSSFDNVSQWINEVDKAAPVDITKFLVGCKSDLTSERVIERSEGEELANRYDMPFIETSAKSSANVEEAFTRMVLEIKKNLDNKPKAAAVTSTTKLSDKKAKKEGNEKKCIIC
ncbi:ras family small GTPase [Naegleria gruberi]|uniref:Ras family small GTPase n=1 Tax=Naegleria gruberi TaxID=5762 RepID=D2VCT8_NAEGR|nr:ras family small GTPase [Naegleria gruberi]EFC45478.1 ras family small GTPase [Naegleria gruberi]|eukprot:XP_002678222.1 ras family small GTPase [Naegleria gruberi strain NEG-M]